MVKLVQKRRETLQQQQIDFERDLANFPPRERTNRDEPFWNRHTARKLLKEDVESGRANLMKPGELRQTRPEYQDFKSSTFAKHVYQETSKQKSGTVLAGKMQKDMSKATGGTSGGIKT